LFKDILGRAFCQSRFILMLPKAFIPSLSLPCHADLRIGDDMCVMSGRGSQTPNEPVSNPSFDEEQPITPRWPKAAAAVELGQVCPPAMRWPLASSTHAWPSMGSSPRAQKNNPRPSTPRPSPRQCCDVVMTVKNTFINMAIGRPLSMDDFLPERVTMSCPATARRPLSSRGGERRETVVASAFDKLETAFIEEAMLPTNSATKPEDAPADLDNDACSSPASALLKIEEDTPPMTSACEAEDGPSNLDAEMKAERTILTPLRIPIPQRGGQEPWSPASSSSVAGQVEADYGSAAAIAMTPPSKKQVLRLGDGLVQLPPWPEQQHQWQHPKLGSRELPTVGSAGHHVGGCKPCAFAHTKGCENGVNCNFCHLCEPGEKKRRQKRRMLAAACQVEVQLKAVHHQRQPAAAAAAATGMGHAMCRPMMSSPVVSRPVLLPSTGNWVGSPTTSHCTNGGWPAGASPTASNAVGGHTPPAAQLQCQQPFNPGAWPVAASLPAARNAIGGWQNPQLRMAAVFNVF